MRGHVAVLSRLLGPEVFGWCARAAKETLPGAVDFVGCRIFDADAGSGMLLSAPLGEGDALTSQRRRLLRAVVQGIEADFRTRNALQLNPDTLFDAAAAVLDDSGRVLDACQEAAAVLPRATSFVKALRQTATRRSQLDGEGVIKAWQGYLDGEWSLANVSDESGELRWILHRNPTSQRTLRRLTAKERFALLRRAQGASGKVVAAETNVPESTVQGWMSQARRKLGLRTWADLGRILAVLPNGAIEAGLEDARRDLLEEW